jgi:hypothetical protein
MFRPCRVSLNELRWDSRKVCQHLVCKDILLAESLLKIFLALVLERFSVTVLSSTKMLSCVQEKKNLPFWSHQLPKKLQRSITHISGTHPKQRRTAAILTLFSVINTSYSLKP